MKCSQPKHSVRSRAAAALVVLAALNACSSPAQDQKPQPPPPLKVLPPADLDSLLLSANDINAVMGTNALVADQTSSELIDDRNILPNLNCLGILQVAQKGIYGDSGLSGVRSQRLRQPPADTWDSLVMQAALAYPTPEAAKSVFDESSDRWSKCTHHRVNITINDQPVKTFWFADLTKSSTDLSMTVTQGQNERSCQHALSLASNVIVDVRACGHTSTDQAVTIAHKMTDRIGH